MRQRGVTLIELAIGLAIAGILLAMALPSFSTFLRNAKVKTFAENMQTGLVLARTEALRRNATVRFQLVTNLTASCAIVGTASTTSTPAWIVSQDDPTGACNATPGGSTSPRIIQTWSGEPIGGAGGVAWNITTTGATNSAVTFNGLGRITTALTGNSAQWDIQTSSTNTDWACQPTGPLRCLRVKVTNGGDTRTCDPLMSVTTDPRHCN